MYKRQPEGDILNVILETNFDLKLAVNNLVNLALERGGNDNITVALVQYE